MISEKMQATQQRKVTDNSRYGELDKTSCKMDRNTFEFKVDVKSNSHPCNTPFWGLLAWLEPGYLAALPGEWDWEHQRMLAHLQQNGKGIEFFSGCAKHVAGILPGRLMFDVSLRLTPDWLRKCRTGGEPPQMFLQLVAILFVASLATAPPKTCDCLLSWLQSSTIQLLIPQRAALLAAAFQSVMNVSLSAGLSFSAQNQPVECCPGKFFLAPPPPVPHSNMWCSKMWLTSPHMQAWLPAEGNNQIHQVIDLTVPLRMRTAYWEQRTTYDLDSQAHSLQGCFFTYKSRKHVIFLPLCMLHGH